jgi:SAM-dependent methyltransferase
MKTLTELQEIHKFLTDKNTSHSYFEVYEELFSSFHGRKINLLELGIYKGGSLLLWKEYFPQANIFGLDRKEHVFRDDMAILEAYGIITMLINYDLTTENTFDYLTFDIVIDDLSHDLIHQIKTFEIFRHKLAPGGVLIIEDIRPENFYYWKYITTVVPNCTIRDRRSVKNRYDDVLFVYKPG